MSASWTPLAITYVGASVVGLVGTWTLNVVAIVQARNFIGDWVTSGPAVGSLAIDILLVAIVVSVFIVVEGRRRGMRHLWVYIVLIPLVALASALPLFLAMRERAIARSQPPHAQNGLTA